MLKFLFKNSQALQAWPSKFFFSGTILLWILCIMPFELSALFELREGQKKLPFEILSRGFSSFFLGLCFSSVVSTYIIVIKNRNNTEHPTILKKFTCLFAPFKQNLLSILFYPLLMTKLVSYPLIIFYISNGLY